MTTPIPATAAISAEFGALLEAQLDRPVALLDNTRFAEDLGLDSVDAIIFLGAIEEKFNIELPLTNFDHVQTVGELRVHLDRELAKLV